jgi:hypothetical protein
MDDFVEVSKIAEAGAMKKSSLHVETVVLMTIMKTTVGGGRNNGKE